LEASDFNNNNKKLLGDNFEKIILCCFLLPPFIFLDCITELSWLLILTVSEISHTRKFVCGWKPVFCFTANHDTSCCVVVGGNESFCLIFSTYGIVLLTTSRGIFITVFVAKIQVNLIAPSESLGLLTVDFRYVTFLNILGVFHNKAEIQICRP
jgi:hypothetical protein